VKRSVGLTQVGEFHQHSMYSFYACGAQNRKKNSQVVSLFMLLGSTSVKAERKYVGEIEPNKKVEINVADQRRVVGTSSKRITSPVHRSRKSQTYF